MRHVQNGDGETQQEILFPMGEVTQTPKTKAQIAMRIGWLVGVLKAGIHDFDRYLLDEKQIKAIAATKNHKYALIEGSLYSVAIARNYVKWAAQWGVQRWEIEQEIERLRVQLQEYD